MGCRANVTSHKEHSIRPATAEDVEVLATMRFSLQEHMTRANPELLPLSEQGIAAFPVRYREAIADTHAHIVVAQAQDTEELIGMAMGRVTRREDLIPAQAGRIDDVWVEPSWRRQGICRALMKELLAFFERFDIEVLVLDYVVGNGEAEDTWHQLGFHPVLTLAKANVGDVKQRTGGSTV